MNVEGDQVPVNSGNGAHGIVADGRHDADPDRDPRRHSRHLMLLPRKLLFLIADGFPTHRPDVSILFGVELPRHGITCDLVAQDSGDQQSGEACWPFGHALVCRRTGSRMRDQLMAFWHDCRNLCTANAEDYDAIQVRDKVFAGLVGLACARWRKLPFFFWMSFPKSEGFIELARRERLSLGFVRWAIVAIKGHVGKHLIYKLLLPRCDHVFVQSDHMASDLVRHGIRRDRMTPVQMGVDLDRLASVQEAPEPFKRKLAGRRVIAYLGVLDRARRIDFLFEALAEVRKREPNACLLLIGDTNEAASRRWLECRAAELNVNDAVIWTGWVPAMVAWGYLRHADLAVSLVPRSDLFDCASPTKVVEYLALGLPVVANNQPDQHKVLSESGAGLSVAMRVDEFASAILSILNDPEMAAAMSSAGPPYVSEQRSYSLIGAKVANVYRNLWLKAPDGQSSPTTI